MKRCVFSPRARKDFSEILGFIGRTSPDSALDFVTRLQLMCDRLAEMPELGRKRDDLLLGMRAFPIERYTIFYRITKSGVEIVRVLHGARDVESIFNDD
jgi:toxin ParE1/3/4